MAEQKALVEIAYEIMKDKKTISLSTLWSSVTKQAGLSKEDADKKIANFYTQLSLDGRFVALGNNKWSLRDRLPYDKVHVDLSDFYNDLEEETEGDEEDEEAPKKEAAPTEEAQ